jgi:hypothetical protein
MHGVGVATSAGSTDVVRRDEDRVVSRLPVRITAHLEEGALVDRGLLYLLDQLLGLPLGELRLVGENDTAEESDLDPID